MKRIEVVAAVIQHQNKILAVQRGPAKYAYISEKWEFPGGKMEAEETEEQTIIREIREELDMQIAVKAKLLTVEHSYPDFHLTMHTYLCETEQSEPILTEHLAFRWLSMDELEVLDWAGADVPIVEVLQQIVIDEA
jgi:8-oxo-dGTP diphosphatase